MRNFQDCLTQLTIDDSKLCTLSNDDSNPQQGTNTKSRKGAVDGFAPSKKPDAPLQKNSSPTGRVPSNKKDERKLFVGGLPGVVNDTKFRLFFEKFGQVVDSVVMYDRETHNSRGFGFVTFKEASVAHTVLGGLGKTSNKIIIHDQECEVKVSIPKQSNSGKEMNQHTNRCESSPQQSNRDGNGLIHHKCDSGCGSDQNKVDATSATVENKREHVEEIAECHPCNQNEYYSMNYSHPLMEFTLPPDYHGNMHTFHALMPPMPPPQQGSYYPQDLICPFFPGMLDQFQPITTQHVNPHHFNPGEQMFAPYVAYPHLVTPYQHMVPFYFVQPTQQQQPYFPAVKQELNQAAHYHVEEPYSDSSQEDVSNTGEKQDDELV